MKAVKSLFGEFSKGGGVIKVLQPIVTSVMTTLFAWGTKAVGVIHSIVTWLLNSGKAGGMFSGAIKVLSAGWSALKAIFSVVATALAPMVSLLKAVFSNAMVLKGIKTIFTIIAAVVMVVVVAFVAFVAIVATIAGVVAGAFAAVVGTVTGAVSGIIDALTGFDFSAFVAKMAGMASAGLAAFKGIFGIASPSSVLLEHGEDDMAGAAATGVDKGAPKLEKSMSKMGGDAMPGKPAGKGKPGPKSGAFFDIHDNHFGGDMDESKLHEWMDSWWEKTGLQGGMS